MNNRHGIYEKFWAKVLAVFLLCALGAGIVWAGIGMIIGASDYVSADSFYETHHVNSMMEENGRSILINQLYEGTAVDNYTNSNYLYKTYKRNNYGRYELTDENYAGNDANTLIGAEKTLYFEVQKDNKEFFRQYKAATAATADMKNYDYYMIEMKVRDPLLYRDRLYSAMEIYNMYKPVSAYLVPAVTIMAVLMALVLLFAFLAAGHAEGVEGIHLLWIDSVPWELFAAVTAFGVFTAGAASSAIIEVRYTELRLTLLAIIAVMMAGSLIIYAFLMSTARRLKGHVFRQNSWICRGLAWCRKFVNMIPAVWRTALIVTAWMIIRVICLVFHTEPEAVFIMFLTDIAAFVYVIIAAFSGRELLLAGEKLTGGEPDYRINDEKMKLMIGPMRMHARSLNEIGGGMQIALEKEIRSERMKTELITNVSHDIKTPLTSIINYVDLLQKEHTDEQEKEYLEVLARQSAKLKRLTEDIVEASKASTGNISADIAPAGVREILDQSAAEYQEKLEQGDLHLITNIADEDLRVMADGRLLWRIMSNLFSNVIKYAMPSTRVYLDARRDEHGMVRISMKNISRDPLNISADELTERFVRGDESRHTEGSGLGLNIARSLAEIQKGKLEITVDGDLFRADILLPEAPAE